MEHGKITNVIYEDGVVYCNVQPVRTESEYEAVPVMKSHSGFVQVPKRDQRVAMDKLSDGTRFISDILGTRKDAPEDMKEGEIILQLGENTFIQFDKAGDSYDVSISASGDLSLLASGKITLDADGGVFINGTKFGSHTHDYSWSDSAGSGTTDSPN